MIEFYKGSRHDVNHFLKVWVMAKTIGELEGLDSRTQQVLELTAVIHDIACPPLAPCAKGGLWWGHAAIKSDFLCTKKSAARRIFFVRSRTAPIIFLQVSGRRP